MTAQQGDVQRWLIHLFEPQALLELGLLALVIGASALLVWQLGRHRGKRGGVWFGERVFDGALFPLVALIAVFLTHLAASHYADLQSGWFSLAIPVLLSLLVIRLAVRTLHAAFPQSALMRVVERWLSWLVWIALVLWLTDILPLALGEMDKISWRVAGTQLTLRSLVEGALNAAVVVVVTLWLSAAIETRLLAGTGDAGFSGNLSFRKMAANATRALLLLVGLLFALSAAGIPLGALSVFGGALGVGIGLGLQKLASNYVSGFVLLAESGMRIGDVIRIDGFEGRITDITTRYTVIRALNGRESIVPNEMMMTQRVESLTLLDPRVALSTTVEVGYDTDVESLLPAIVQTVRSVDRVLADPGPSVLLSKFGANGLELSVGFWIADPHAGQGNVQSAVNRALLLLLRARGVEIPFPQQVVHNAEPAPPASSAATAATVATVATVATAAAAAPAAHGALPGPALPAGAA